MNRKQARTHEILICRLVHAVATYKCWKPPTVRDYVQRHCIRRDLTLLPDPRSLNLLDPRGPRKVDTRKPTDAAVSCVRQSPAVTWRVRDLPHPHHFGKQGLNERAPSALGFSDDARRIGGSGSVLAI